MKVNAGMIVTDLDKTLLDNEGRISDYSKRILEKCLLNGIHIVFATARPVRATTIFYPAIKPSSIICHNGAVIMENEKTIYHCGIDPEMCGNLIKTIGDRFPVANLAAEVNDRIYANFNPAVYWGKIDYDDLNKRPTETAEKIITGINNNDEFDTVKKLIPGELYLEKNQGSLGGDIGLIMNRGATKWNAAKYLAAYYNIETRNVTAFGDNENDLEMVKYSGWGVAVENGIDEIKKTARYVCDSNINDGVAKWIEKYIL